MKRQGEFLRIVLAAVLAATVSWGVGGEAATRQEVAAICVNTAADFQYWQSDSPTLKSVIKFVEEANNPQSPHYIPTANRIAVFRKGGAIRGAFVG